MKNSRVVLYSIVALVSLALAIFLHWLFIVPAVVLMILNQRELMRKKK